MHGRLVLGKACKTESSYPLFHIVTGRFVGDFTILGLLNVNFAYINKEGD